MTFIFDHQFRLKFFGVGHYLFTAAAVIYSSSSTGQLVDYLPRSWEAGRADNEAPNDVTPIVGQGPLNI